MVQFGKNTGDYSFLHNQIGGFTEDRFCRFLSVCIQYIGNVTQRYIGKSTEDKFRLTFSTRRTQYRLNAYHLLSSQRLKMNPLPELYLDQYM